MLLVVTIVSLPLLNFFFNRQYGFNISFFYGRQFAFNCLHHVHDIFRPINPIAFMIGMWHADVSEFTLHISAFGSTMNQEKCWHS